MQDARTITSAITLAMARLRPTRRVEMWAKNGLLGWARPHGAAESEVKTQTYCAKKSLSSSKKRCVAGSCSNRT
jgi:hypothetical protein